MFSLNDSLRYWLYSEPTDMRKSFFSLSGIVTDRMSKDIHSTDVFIFLNRPCTRIKLLHMEPGGLVIYSKMLDGGTFARPKVSSDGGIQYTYGLLPRLRRYVRDGKYNIDNNLIENAIRPLAIRRKNYLFCGNTDSAIRTSIVYSLIASCKAAQIEPRAWLEDVLTKMPEYETGTKDITPLLPTHWKDASNNQ